MKSKLIGHADWEQRCYVCWHTGLPMIEYKRNAAGEWWQSALACAACATPLPFPAHEVGDVERLGVFYEG